MVYGVQVNRMLHVKETVRINNFTYYYFNSYSSGFNDRYSNAKGQ